MPSDDDYDFLFKIVIVGDTNVGKTQIMSRFIDNQFTHDSKPTVGVQFGTKTIKVGDVWVKNQIWDTAGQQKFRALTCSYYRGAVGAIVVFDLSKNVTFQHLQRWIKQAKQHSEPEVCILMIGNKNDIEEHQVRQQDIQNFASDHKLLYISTSAATGQNIQMAFDTLSKQILGQVSLEDNIGDFQDSQPDLTPGQIQNKQQVVQTKQQSNKNPSLTQIDKKQKNQKQKPKIQSFSIQQSNKPKLNVGKNKNKQPKKKCC